MNLYGDYLKRIQEVTRNQSPSVIEKSYQDRYSSNRYSDYQDSQSLIQKTEITPQISLRPMADLLGIKEINPPKCGDHPDFTYLRSFNGTEYHNIVSVFIDVKKSTNLFRNYSHEQIHFIIQTISLASTHTCALLGGHIHRMQYDGVFVYFGGKKIKKEDAIKQAIIATSLFSYFVKYELKKVFQQNEIERIFTRIGIDFGDDSDVFWAIYGSGECTELTTTSLHTSLAPKMQANAESNGIIVGENVASRLGIEADFCELLKDENGNINYIFTNPYYKQYKFDWVNFLYRTYSFFKKDDKGNLFFDYEEGVNNQKKLESLEQAVNILKSSNAYLHKNNEISVVPNQNSIPKNSFYHK